MSAVLCLEGANDKSVLLTDFVTMQQQVYMWFKGLHPVSVTCQVLALWLTWLKLCAMGLCSNRGPHGELLFLLPRMDEMRHPHEVMKIDFHTPAIIRNAGRTLAARDVVDILRVYIKVLHCVVGESFFLPLRQLVHQRWCCLLSMLVSTVAFHYICCCRAGVAFHHSWCCLSSNLMLPESNMVMHHDAPLRHAFTLCRLAEPASSMCTCAQGNIKLPSRSTRVSAKQSRLLCCISKLLDVACFTLMMKMWVMLQVISCQQVSPL